MASRSFTSTNFGSDRLFGGTISSIIGAILVYFFQESVLLCASFILAIPIFTMIFENSIRSGRSYFQWRVGDHIHKRTKKRYEQALENPNLGEKPKKEIRRKLADLELDYLSKWSDKLKRHRLE
jgi:hypothetical protein